MPASSLPTSLAGPPFQRRDEQLATTGLLRLEVDAPAVRSDLVVIDRAVESCGHLGRLGLQRPGPLHEARQVVDPLRRNLLRQGEQPAPVRGKAWLRVVASGRGQPPRLAARGTHLPQRQADIRARRLVALRRRGEHHGRAVRRPVGVERLARVAEPAAETAGCAQGGASEQVERLGAGIERLHDQRRLALVEPAIPVADRKRVVAAGVVLAGLAFLAGLAVVGVAARARVTRAWSPATGARPGSTRAGCAAGETGGTLSFAAAGEMEHVRLALVVAFTLRRERDAGRVRTPGHVALAGLSAVSLRGGRLPSEGTIHRSLDLASSSYDGSATPNTIHLPSGLTAGALTRVVSQTSSCVIGRGAGGSDATAGTDGCQQQDDG